jgi:hypothetical protein
MCVVVMVVIFTHLVPVPMVVGVLMLMRVRVAAMLVRVGVSMFDRRGLFLVMVMMAGILVVLVVVMHVAVLLVTVRMPARAFVAAVRVPLVDVEFHALDVLPLRTVIVHVEVAEMQLAQFPLEGARLHAEVDERADHHVAADSRDAVEVKGFHAWED